MVNGPAVIQKRRLLRMTVAHYRQQNVSEEDFYRFVTERHALSAAKLHAKNGIEGFAIYFAPKSFRVMTSTLNNQRGNPWVVRDYDAQVEFLFRDMETFYKGVSDPEFQVLQAEEEPFISGIHAEISIGWIETYVKDGNVVGNGGEGGGSQDGEEKLTWSELSAAPVVG